ncbi:tRNA 2-thiouridine(34) synthase MnmA [Candidatus Parcubacteria bacterium]|nr:tRNA 2-thiouridine(34) synthase MnmA [Candidatus Parcubacteria bacterium]
MKKVFVGVSGGVDSSVSAALLKDQGYDVTGVFIKVWQPDFIECNWKDEMRDAMRVCAKLEIPFLLCDLEKEYKEGVVNYMIDEYKAGRTPNPDVMCNKEIKFKAFLNFALEKGADFIATGHYAQKKELDDSFGLFESGDKEKDQTYFIWNLNQEILKNVLFPIGHLKKEEVRKMAEKKKLLTSNKKDSQGLCFIGHVDMKDFLKKFIDTKKGKVLNEKGDVIGEHDGAVLYTIGERHHFELFQKNPNQKNLYVISKDLENNTITLSEKKITQDSKKIKIDKVNLIREISEKDEIEARIRYRQPLQEGKIIKINKESVEIEFKDPQESITSGQSLVIYKNSECLGGGVIV